MSAFSTYLSQQIINGTLRGQALTVPATLYLAQFTASPTDNNATTNEVAGAWYARQLATSWAAPVGAGNVTSNSNQIQYNAVTGAAVVVSHWGLYDAATGGNLLYHGAHTTPKTLNVGDVIVVGVGQLQITVD